MQSDRSISPQSCSKPMAIAAWDRAVAAIEQDRPDPNAARSDHHHGRRLVALSAVSRAVWPTAGTRYRAYAARTATEGKHMIVGIIIVLFLGFWVVTAANDRRARITEAQAPASRAQAAASRAQAAARRAQQARIVCQQCQTAGRVTTTPVKVRKGMVVFG
jgi:hypothetical protein